MTIDGNPVITHVDARMTLAFLPNGQAGGFGSVNQFSGTYSFSPNGKLTWGKGGFSTTRKAGAPELMDKERQYLSALREVTAAVVSKYGLQMENDDGSTKLVFR
jgi:heat shock protein HslJ